MRLRPRKLVLCADTFEVLYRREAKRMLAYLTRRCGSPELALDLVSQTFVEGFQKRRQFRGRSLEEASAWLWTIARRQLADYGRRGQVERRVLQSVGAVVPRPLADDEYERIEQLAGMEELCDLVREHFEALPEEQREALLYRVVNGSPYDEVARKLGISEEAARARVSRGLRALARKVQST